MQEYLTVELPPKPESAGWSREALREFRDRLEGDAFVDLQLIVSELVADAVRSEEKDSRPITLRIELGDRHLRVEVRDGAAAYELRPRRPEFGERGWGVYLTRTSPGTGDRFMGIPMAPSGSRFRSRGALSNSRRASRGSTSGHSISPRRRPSPRGATVIAEVARFVPALGARISSRACRRRRECDRLRANRPGTHGYWLSPSP